MNNQPMVKGSDALKAGAILGGIFLFEGFFVGMSSYGRSYRFFTWLGFLPGTRTAPLVGWFCAVVVTVVFVLLSARFPSVRENMFRLSWLKLLSLGVAFVAGILEEIAFRQLLMDSARHHGANAAVQVLLSAIAFGAIHGVWTLFRGSWRAGIGAMLATGILGGALALVYLASVRSLAPCVTAHFFINVFAEPGLVLAAVRGEMGRGSPVPR